MVLGCGMDEYILGSLIVMVYIYKVIIDYYPIKLEGHKGGVVKVVECHDWWLAVSALYILAFKWQSYAIGI